MPRWTIPIQILIEMECQVEADTYAQAEEIIMPKLFNALKDAAKAAGGVKVLNIHGCATHQPQSPDRVRRVKAHNISGDISSMIVRRKPIEGPDATDH